MLKWEMAIMFPKVFPHDLKVKPKLAGEKIAFEALDAGLDESWSVFFDRPVAGTQRRFRGDQSGAWRRRARGERRACPCAARRISSAHHGTRLKDLLDKVRIKKETIEIVFNGADGPIVDKTPDFIKSIPIWKAMDPDTLVAYEMNGQPLPHFNGFPARIVVPGWTGTYWMKHVTSITAMTKPETGFWMNPAYRIPLGKFPLVARFTSQDTSVNTPITEMVVNSLITSHAQDASVRVGSSVNIGGIAWDAGYGVETVEISTDGGKTWLAATLGEDLGRYAFRPFSFPFSPKTSGRRTVMARAINKIGQTQPTQLIHNPAGYHTLKVTVWMTL
jgi:sulfite dehydrogenase (cytochrome) subunit A